MSGSSELENGPGRRRWQLSDLIALVAIAALGLGTFREAGPAGSPLSNAFRNGVYLLTLAVASVSAFTASRRWRPFWSAWAAFGGLYLVFVLHGGFGVSSLGAAQVQAEWAILGLPLGLLAGLICQLFADRTDRDPGRRGPPP